MRLLTRYENTRDLSVTAARKRQVNCDTVLRYASGEPLVASQTRAATTTVYRAVSNAEYQSILDTGQFTQGPNSLEGKWFSDSLEGAQLHGDALHGPGNYQIIQADVPNDAPSLFQQPNLDGRGPARYLDLQDLSGVQPKPVGGN
jgi:hypothetical protein